MAATLEPANETEATSVTKTSTEADVVDTTKTRATTEGGATNAMKAGTMTLFSCETREMVGTAAAAGAEADTHETNAAAATTATVVNAGAVEITMGGCFVRGMDRLREHQEKWQEAKDDSTDKFVA